MNIIQFNRYKRFLIIVLLLFSVITVSAQESQEPKGELSFYLKGVNSKLNFEKAENGSFKPHIGAGIQYNYYLTQGLSFSGGLEYQLYSSETIIDNFIDSYSLIDAEGDDMIFRISADEYHERHSVDMLNIPLLIQWETKGLSTRFFSATGIQLGIPIAATYKGRADGLETSGYFPQWDVLLTSPQFMGFGEWGVHHSGKEKLKLKKNYSFLFELGIKQQLKKVFHHLYVSAYLELGLNDLKKGSDKQALISYNTNNPTGFSYASLIYSSPQAIGENYVNKVNIQSFGLRIRFSSNL